MYKEGLLRLEWERPYFWEGVNRSELRSDQGVDEGELGGGRKERRDSAAEWLHKIINNKHDVLRRVLSQS